MNFAKRSRVPSLLLFVLAASACGGHSSPASSDAGSTPAVTIGPLAEQLLDHPTEALLKQAAAEHVPTDDEVKLVAAYWAGLIVTINDGSVPEAFLATNLTGAVRRLATKYPSFFPSDPSSASAIVSALEPPPAESSSGCGKCFSAKSGVVLAMDLVECTSIAKIYTALKALRGLAKTSETVSMARALWNTFQGAYDSGVGGLDAAVAVARTINAKDARKLIKSVVDITLVGVEAAAAATAAAPAVAIIGGVVAGVECGMDLKEEWDKYSECEKAQSTQCPDGSTDTMPPDACVGPEDASAAGGGLDASSDASIPSPDASTSDASTPPMRLASAGGWGDPHLYTWDGHHYDFQHVGEFVLVQDGSFVVQVRLHPYGTSTTVATISTLAANVDGDRVEIAAGTAGPVFKINGLSSSPASLPNGGTLASSSITWRDGTTLQFTNRGTYLSVQVKREKRASTVGLLGDADGVAADDLRLRDGTVLHPPLSQADRPQFTSAWRVQQSESLFTYASGEDTNTYTDLTFPSSDVTASSLAPGQYDSAKATCMAAGVSDPEVIAACILDVGTTGDPSFADDARGVPIAGNVLGDYSGSGWAVASGTIAHAEKRTYSFLASTGEGIQLRVADASNNAFVPGVTVYDPAGKTVSTESGASVAATSFTAAATGMFSVVVSDASNSTSTIGDYNLYFTLAPGADEGGGALSPASMVSGTIELGDLDSYTFTAQKGQGVQLRVVDAASGAFVPAFVVYDPSGATVMTQYGGDVAAAAFTTQATGTYTVVVYDYSTGYASSGDYNLYFTLAPGANEAGALASGTEVSGTIDKGDLDSYTFVAAAGQGVQLRVADVDSGAFVPAFVVYEPSGTTVMTQYGGDVAAAAFTTQAAGIYTVVVYDYSTGYASSGNYKLYFTSAPGANEGGALTPGSVASGTIDKGDLDSYTFSATTGESIQLQVTDTAGGAFEPAIVVYDPSGTTVITQYGSDVATATFATKTAGLYTLVVYDYSTGYASSGNYTLLLTLP